MRVYCAGKWEHRQMMRGLMNEVEKLGHTVTHDWTVKETDTEGQRNTDFMRECGEADVEGVRSADVLLLVNHPEGYGLMTELGIAIALRKRIIVVFADLRNTVFWYVNGVTLVDDIPHALQLLGTA